MLKHSFLGSNTPNGFVGFFGEAMSRSRAVILKGGPGTGKSTLLKKIGAYAQSIGLEVEYYHCSSDPDSLDGVYIPKINYVALDGTSPHALDAPLPIVNETVVNLADNASIAAIEGHEGEIRVLLSQKRNHFSVAYDYLKAAGAVNDIISKTELSCLNFSHLSKLAEKLALMVKNKSRLSSRTYFAHALTPKGMVDYIADITEDTRVLKVCCPSDIAVKMLIKQIKQNLADKECYFDSLNCPFEPTLAQHLLFDRLLITNSALLHQGEEFELPLSVPSLEEEKENLNKLTNKAVYNLQQAKSKHMQVEKFYIEAMDFADINKKTDKVLNLIFN